MKTVMLAINAMATRFELILHGTSESLLRAAGEAALHEIVRLEEQLSLFRPSSEIAHINAKASFEPVPVSHPVFQLLSKARTLNELTQGAFDITVGPLMRAWGFAQGEPQEPSSAQLTSLMEVTGMRHVILDDATHTVRFDKPGVMIDLGAIGKGYAVDEAIDILKESSVEGALLHGGTSTVYGLGLKPDGSKWTVSLEDPTHSDRAAKGVSGMQMQVLRSSTPDLTRESAPAVLGTVELHDQAMSVSSPRGKFFESGGHIFGHVLDPRTGWPTVSAHLAAVRTNSATDSDALSTGLLVLGTSATGYLERIRPGLKTWIL